MAAPESRHDVFLSFLKQDTQNNFVCDLRRSFKRAGIGTFSVEEQPREDLVSSSTLEAIENSCTSVIVFSKNFASSVQCLEEAARILQCRNSKRQPVAAVFFHVEPRDVKKQEGVFKKKFKELEKNDPQKVKTWRSALQQAADISGWHINENVDQAAVVQKIVDHVSKKLSLKGKL